jgi:hypothetical protein
MSLDPMGSTNYGKLTNVSIVPEASATAVLAATGLSNPNGVGTGYYQAQTFEFVITCINNNIIRVSGGALGKHGKPRTGRCFKSCGKTFREKHLNYHQSAVSIC